jgi:folate-dependent phosphoribosylglycinamide formyltransferase PurN
MQPLRLAVLLSGSGRTLDNLLERITSGHLAATIELVVSPRGAALADFSHAIFDACERCPADLVVMAGFLHLVRIPSRFAGRVINIHPSLLPAFGGKGFHGMHVHRAVIDRGCTISGCTVHLVDDEYDHGRILLQKSVPVLPDDTPDSLAARVFAAECEALPEAIARFRR